MKKFLYCFWTLLAFSSLTNVWAQTKMTAEQYINTYKDIAINEMHTSKIPASITLAQGLLESGNGNSRLAKKANNHFGIKCKKNWTGPSIREDDDELQECFRAYKTAAESYKDHSNFLMSNARYGFLFDLKSTDYKGWARGLKKAGYATNPKYPELLITLIERHELYKYDKAKPGKKYQTDQPIVVKDPPKKQGSSNNNSSRIARRKFLYHDIPVVVAAKGDSYTKIALRNELMIWQIYKYNDLEKDAILKAGDTLYLKPKRGRAAKEYHTVKLGETMHSISQTHTIKLKKLYKKNLLLPGQEPAIGERIYLRAKRTKAPKLRDPNARPKSVAPTKPAEAKKPVKPSTPAAEKKPEAPTKTTKVSSSPPKTEKPIVSTTIPNEVKEPLAESSTKKDDQSNFYFFHTVQKGETLFAIADRYHLTIEQLMDLNGLTANDIKEGSKLIINQHMGIQKDEPKIASGTHVVEPKETIYSLAKKYNLTVEELKALNNLKGNDIKIGDELIILSNYKPDPESNTPQYHTVAKGETLFSVSKKYDLTVDELKKLNNTNTDSLSIGQKVRVR